MVQLSLLYELFMRIPLIFKTILLHGTRMSPGTGKQNLRTEVLVAIFRSFMNFSKPVTVTQQNSMRDPGIKGPMWVSKVTLPCPEFDVRDAILQAIDDLKSGDVTFDIPAIASVEAEWTGYRDVGKNVPLPDISEEAKYLKLREEVSSDMTILYFHGGAYCLMDPCTHRVPVARLSRLTGAPVLSVRYRLAPQNPFPAALVDALTAYLSLIYPPPGALHDPVPANKIVIAGDSAGGNLSLVLLQALLTLRRASRSISFHGKTVSVELPAGVAGISPWCDISRSMPSVVHNANIDYISLPVQSFDDPTPFKSLSIPADEAWPVCPPRVDMYVNAPTTNHPLVSPLAARIEHWKDSPPVFVSVGEESLTDEGLIVARRIHQAGASVIAEQFEGMPHCHGMIMLESPTGKRFFESLSGFCRDAAAGQVTPTGTLTWLGFKLRETLEIPIEDACAVSDKQAEALMKRALEYRMHCEKELQMAALDQARRI